MKKKIIKAAMLGCGNRGISVAGNLLRDSQQNVKIIAIYDPDPEEMKRAQEMLKSPDALLCESYEEAIRTKGVDWVLVFSPNAYHREQIEAAFKAGKDVFSEKPLATSIKDCQSIYQKYVKSNCKFATGFVLRYSQIYRTAKEILDSGKIGKLLSINADENIRPAHGGYIMRNWRRHTSEAGPHILEKCCHDLDLINWFCGSLPSKVAAFGGLDFFIPKNEVLIKKYGADTFQCWRDTHASPKSAFKADKDLMDTQVCIALYRNGIKVNFQATMSNEIPERRMYFSCTEGTMILELYSATLQYKRLGEQELHTINFRGDLHGGGDAVIMKELYEDVMVGGGDPKCSGSEGLESAVFALALDQAMHENKVIDLEDIWKKLGR